MYRSKLEEPNIKMGTDNAYDLYYSNHTRLYKPKCIELTEKYMKHSNGRIPCFVLSIICIKFTEKRNLEYQVQSIVRAVCGMS